MTKPTEYSLALSPLDLDLTLDCGQTFRWQRLRDGAWRGLIGEHLVEVRQSGGSVMIISDSKDASVKKEILTYFRAQDDLREIQKRLAKDRMLSAGIGRLRGLRLVKIPEWECIISYVLATYSNIPRIKNMIESISREYGRRIAEGTFSFPDVDSLREASVRDLRSCGLGYRAEYVNSICGMLDDVELRHLSRLSYADLREALKALPGVGDKVADCISLFGFGRLEAFPIDIWVRRALERLYGVTGSYEALRRFGSDRFGLQAGYAQEYLFFNERVAAKRGMCMFSGR